MMASVKVLVKEVGVIPCSRGDRGNILYMIWECFGVF